MSTRVMMPPPDSAWAARSCAPEVSLIVRVPNVAFGCSYVRRRFRVRGVHLAHGPELSHEVVLCDQRRGAGISSSVGRISPEVVS